jgi:hypothetical protein
LKYRGLGGKLSKKTLKSKILCGTVPLRFQMNIVETSVGRRRKEAIVGKLQVDKILDFRQDGIYFEENYCTVDMHLHVHTVSAGRGNFRFNYEKLHDNCT